LNVSVNARFRAASVAIVALLTSAVHASSLLYDQINSCGGNYLVSQYVESDTYYEFRAADDFLVPAGADWSIEQVTADGGFFGGGLFADSFDVFFYDDAAGAPGDAIAACANAGVPYVKSVNSFTVSLSAPCVLSGGTGGRAYWVSMQANVPDISYADWGWHERTVLTGNASRVEYPGGAEGSACLTWGLKTDCVGAFESANPDQCFSLSGVSPVIFGNDFEGPPAGDCTSLAKITVGNTAFKWPQQTAGTVTFGDNTSANVSFTSYTSIWNEGTANPWPGANALNLRPALVGTVYLAEAFSVPLDGSVSGTITWTNNKNSVGYNAANNAASYAISKCAGDFGQSGTQLQANCAIDIASSAGLTAIVSAVPQAGVCTLTPGDTYYLNILQAPLTGIGQTGAAYPGCSSNCAPWTVRQ
jgi:hypothetical protein